MSTTDPGPRNDDPETRSRLSQTPVDAADPVFDHHKSPDAVAARPPDAPSASRRPVDPASSARQDGDTPIFLARASYRRRRMMDAARLLPLAGAVAFAIPMLWVASGDGGDLAVAAPDTAARTAGGGVYLFVAWAILIVGAALVSRSLSRGDPGPTTPEATDAPVRNPVP